MLYQLPNNAYFASLAGLTNAQVHTKVVRMAMYAALEALSFVAMALVMQKKFNIKALHLVAFVLEHQWVIVQSRLICWILLTLQQPLVHFGTRIKSSDCCRPLIRTTDPMCVSLCVCVCGSFVANDFTFQLAWVQKNGA